MVEIWTADDAVEPLGAGLSGGFPGRFRQDEEETLAYGGPCDFCSLLCRACYLHAGSVPVIVLSAAAHEAA